MTNVKRSGIRNIARKTAVFLLGTAVALVVAELGSRLILPIRWKTCLDMKGKPVDVIADRYHFKSNLVFRQVSEEYDARTCIAPEGYREPSVNGKPDIVFCGDSFCFGTGVEDKDTFVGLFAAETGLRCANLGRPGIGTIGQLGILRHYLDEHGWRPRKVILFMNVSVGSLLPGNDLAYNVLEDIRKEEYPSMGDPSSIFINAPWERRWNIDWALRHFNLLRIARFHLDPVGRLWMSGRSDKERMGKALCITGIQLASFSELGKEHGFECRLVISHPIYDLSAGRNAETAAAIRGLSEDIPSMDVADALRDTEACYFPRDGHFTPLGHRRVAELLFSEYKAGKL